MYDLKPIEEQWKRYHRKKRMPLYIALFLGIPLFAGMSIYLYKFGFPVLTENNKKKLARNSHDFNKTKVEKITNTIVDKSIKEKEQKPVDTIVDEIPILEDDNNKKSRLNIVKSSSLDAYRDVENRFNAMKDIDDSIFLANAYYKMGKYEKSEYWALETIKLDNTIDESWIIFIESKLKLGQREEAISILNDYIKSTGSQKAKNILLKLKTKM